MKSFLEKYKPQKSEEIPQEINLLKELIKNKKHSLIFGPTGTGKTSSIYLIAKELDYETIEVNASDFRTKEQINSIIGSASQQQSLFQKEKLLIIDEVDCLSGQDDRGGASAIVDLIKTSSFPIVITANDIHNEKIKEIKKAVKLIEFLPIKTKDISKKLKEICEKESIKFTEEQLIKISSNSNGDIRAAINDLQANIINKELQTQNDIREIEIGITHILNQVFKQRTINANRALENTDVDLDELNLWLDENTPLEYENKEDLEKAYNIIAKADVFKGRIRRWQYWRFMAYQMILLTSGVSLAKKQINKKFTPYKRAMRPLRIWQLNMKNFKRKSISEKLASNTHISIKEVFKNFNNYQGLLKSKSLQEELKLDQEEIEFIKNLI
ncbi:MAG TPA: replication factor C large subunit [Candidatus Nanoarchaeia archaeon]|nr:replication factor C large subunit [Candidatus Nanoarchaeia archaeon]